MLTALKEKQLLERCSSVGMETTRSGRGITNRDRRERLRAKAIEEGIELETRELTMKTNDDLWKRINGLLPGFVLFESDTRLGVGETGFQKEFRSVVQTAAQNSQVIEARRAFIGAISSSLQQEVEKIFEKLRTHTDALERLTAKPEFLWDKAFMLDILGKDHQGVEKSLDRRGSGLRRLLMVAFFEYLADRSSEAQGEYVFAVEEPENCLHPGLQRDLAASFQQIAGRGYQIIVTSHSPVFVGASPVDDLALVIRERGMARASQRPQLSLSVVAEQLGVEPCDQITGYGACVFVEGEDDVRFWEAAARKLKEAGHAEADFNDRRIGLVVCGGDNLKHWVNRRTMRRLNRRFGVVVDSDRRTSEDQVPQRKLNWKEKCEEDGGVFHILRKREIENYIHPDAVRRARLSDQAYDDFTDMKERYGNNVSRVFQDMSADEILSMDIYQEDGLEHHELKEILQSFLSLTVTTAT
jgi:hypothetical protein